MGFDQYANAAAFRDIIREQVQAELALMSPPYRYGTVATINRLARSCTVTFPGSPTPMPVKMGSIQPVPPGQFVRVEGSLGDRYISDVIGPTATANAAHDQAL